MTILFDLLALTAENVVITITPYCILIHLTICKDITTLLTGTFPSEIKIGGQS